MNDRAVMPEARPILSAARGLVLVGSLVLIFIGVLAGGAGLVASLAIAADQLTLVTASVSFTALAVGLGVALAWQARRSIQGFGSQLFQPRNVWPLVVAFFLVVGFGHAALQADLLPLITFPPMHVLASVLPPLVILALAARSLAADVRSRDVVLQLGSGALVATLLAFTLEMALVLGVVTLVLGAVLVQPGGSGRIEALAGNLQDAAWLQDPSNLYLLLRSPLVVLPALFVFAVAVPLIEEAVKTIGMPLRAYQRPSMPQALLWGLAGGAGFALAEGLFNSLGGMGSWAVIVSFRVGATILHCFTGALMGLAWYFALVEHRWGRGLGLYAASVGIHSLWNLLVAGMAFSSLNVQSSELTSLGPVAAGPGAAIAFSLLASLSLAVAMGLMGVTHRVRSLNAGSAPAAQQISEAIQAPDAARE